MTSVLQDAVNGVPVGCVFALLAVGLVLTYRTSGVFNLAYAAQAYLSAAVFYIVRRDHEWPLLLAVLFAVVIVAPLAGLVLERGLFRHLRNASPAARLVTSLGLLVAIPELVNLLLGSSSKDNPPPMWDVSSKGDWIWNDGSRYALNAAQVPTIIATVVVAVGLTILLRGSSLGLRMRAVVESPRMAQLSGINATRVSMAAWATCSFIAGLTGVLLAPLYPKLASFNFFTLLVASLAACVVGRLASIPLAFAGGLFLGIAQAVLAGSLPESSVLASGLRPGLPFIVLFIMLLLRPPRLGEAATTDPLASVDPPPPPPVSSFRARWLTTGTYTFGVVAAAVGLWLGYFVLDRFWLAVVTGGLVLAIVFLSFTMLTGVGGMLSLCQATFAAIGAFTTAQIVDTTDAPVLAAVLGGTVLAAVVGGVLAVPVLRLPGIYLTLATAAFALMFESVFVPLGWVSGGTRALDVPRPEVFGFDLGEDRAFLVFAAICFALTAGLVLSIRQGTTGRFLDAARGSEDAATSVGIDLMRQRVAAFTVAAGIAGLGGGLLASWTGSASAANYNLTFSFFLGLVWVVVVVTAGARSIQAAIFGGLGFALLPEGLERIPIDWFADHAQGVGIIIFGLGALTFARHPEGIIQAQTSAAIRFIQGLGKGSSPPSVVGEALEPSLANAEKSTSDSETVLT